MKLLLLAKLAKLAQLTKVTASFVSMLLALAGIYLLYGKEIPRIMQHPVRQQYDFIVGEWRREGQ